jgi:hypothetical protein
MRLAMCRSRFTVWLLLIFPACAAAQTLPAPSYHAELVFPLHPLHNHAPGIVECPNGDLLVSWYRGSGERQADDVAVYGARRRKGTGQWSEPFLLADTPGFPDCKELLAQTAEKLNAACPEVRFGIYSAGLQRRDTANPLILASIQSVYQRACELDAFDLVVIDEAHMIPPEGNGMYRHFLFDARTINPNLRIIGFTATPFRPSRLIARAMSTGRLACLGDEPGPVLVRYVPLVRDGLGEREETERVERCREAVACGRA